ncbi:prolyl oligopeptidase family serine peptidase [Wenzhouxiangella sp. AB-CW3]|uniref:S9 family peptidase n=1 Tax=Wenzhouxiangella sp. AB-CW3 TaxID=2771012 RepID=UPI00168B80EF|nr:prolyl oligopeptidase family serine peptidase [Wenzhouxiangella sp. AB-CW3]QOC22270.1 prolyl oligopeptidase family serine peptidase [Wenzhouxiangella sp. AB-CW3]
MPLSTRSLSILALLILACSAAWADDVEPLPVEEVLALGPMPIVTDIAGQSDKRDEMARAMVMQQMAGGLPRHGVEQRFFDTTLQWQRMSPQELPDDDRIWLWAVQVEARRFVSGRLLVEQVERPRLFLAGREVSAGDDGFELHLRNGTHTLWITSHGREEDGAPQISWQGRETHDTPAFHVEPTRRVSPERLTNAETVSSKAVSPDGRYLALAFDARSDAADLDIQRLEIRELSTGRIERQWTAHRPGALAWSPDGAWLAVQDGDNLWLHEAESGRASLLLANHEQVGSWRWHPDSGSVIFAWNAPYEDDNARVRRIRSLEDRWAGFRDNTQLYQVDVASGLIRPLTAGDQSVMLQDIHPEGDRLLVSERIIDYSEPPHSLFRLFEVDLDTLERSEVGQYRLFNGALFADQGYWLLAGPGLPQGDGATTGEKRTPNEYDTQLYRLSADGETATSVSRELDPSLSGIHRLPDGDLLLSAVSGERVILLRFEAGRERWVEIDTGVEVMESFSASETRRPLVVLRGTDADRPQRVHTVDLNRNRHSVLIDSAETEYVDVELAAVEAWSFVNTDGDEIEGRYYLPPDFEPDQHYPLIVYYYGGTTPVNRQFTGRYPFHLWAAQGYVVYVLQPRGTIGYGQEFSALHVNAWGKYTAHDIIEGTEQFVEAHEFIDGDRIGNIGASYGGFMTMHLATLTDLYAASISHAGISALTSYWGEGWWGYGYSGIASRGSFPWNNPELYVGQSPVYSADQITTPLLLVTGDADTNVPPGESHNMYTALKLLDRDVELIEFPGEDHHILDREQRYVWWDTMLAWFDYWLKDEREWWYHLYPEAGEE